MDKQIYISIDFDGTITKFKFPNIKKGRYNGELVPGAKEWINKFVDAGAEIILNTMRCQDDKNYGDVLSPVLKWCKENDIPIHYANEHPTQKEWTSTPKIDALTYIDDKNAGCPLIYPKEGGRPYVDWEIIGPLVLKKIEKKVKNES